MPRTQLDGDALLNHSLTPLDMALWDTMETGARDSQDRPTQFTHTATVEGVAVTIVQDIAWDANANPTYKYTQDKPQAETWENYPVYDQANATRVIGYKWRKL